jgi:dienelactone hydrolase
MLNNEAAEVLGPLYVKHGWAFFMPYRRGQGLSASAGPYMGDEIQKAKTSGGMKAAVDKMIELLTTDHLQDQLTGLTWLKNQKWVQVSRIAVAGNSFGGIETILGAEAGDYCAAIDAAGGAESWGEAPALRKVMKTAVAHSYSPIFFFQAENDFDLSPSQELSEAMRAAEKGYEIKIYPAFGQSALDGHSFAYRGRAVWEADVFEFLYRYCPRFH